MAKLSDAEWVRRFAARVGSQAEAARQLGVSPSMVSLITREKRSGAKYRDMARAGAQGKPVQPVAAPTRAVRRPARRPLPDGGARIVTGSPRVTAREVRRSRDNGRTPGDLTVTLHGVPRASGTPERGGAGGKTRSRDRELRNFSGAVTLDGLTAAEMDMLAEAQDDAALFDLVHDRYPWLADGGRIDRITFVD